MYKVRAQGGMTQAPTSHPSRHEDELTSTEIACIRHRRDKQRLVSLYLDLSLNIILRHSVDPGLHVQSRNSSMNQRRTMIPKTRTILGSPLQPHTSSLMRWDTPNLARMMRRLTLLQILFLICRESVNSGFGTRSTFLLVKIYNRYYKDPILTQLSI
jgi:hypothetical protein